MIQDNFSVNGTIFSAFSCRNRLNEPRKRSTMQFLDISNCKYQIGKKNKNLCYALHEILQLMLSLLETSTAPLTS